MANRVQDLQSSQTTSVYMNDYITSCFKDTQVQVDFLKTNFENSDATWKILQIHHPYISSSSNNTELAPLIDIVEAHNAFVINGHDHCLAHSVFNNTNHIQSGAAGFPQPGDCNNGVALGPFAKFLGANGLQGKLSCPSDPISISC
jgi:tartrate-resistant acid phosphatase type 5